MTFRGYLFSMIVASLIAWAGVGTMMIFVHPDDAGPTGIVLLYTSIFLAVVGILALIGILVRMWLFKQESRATQVAVAFRQAILFAILVDGVLFLSHLQLIRWWILVLFVAFLTILEFLFISLFAPKSIEESADM